MRVRVYHTEDIPFLEQQPPQRVVCSDLKNTVIAGLTPFQASALYNCLIEIKYPIQLEIEVIISKPYTTSARVTTC